MEKKIVSGEKYCVSLETIEFITWKENETEGTWWAKFHLPSGKDIRQVFNTREEMDDFIREWQHDIKAYRTIKIENNEE
jgi:hypothetical protein